ncbi:PREDICTED: uncharacterized protein LOC109230022 [Nicotiana attenuata]|uniref:uncharacterized protein LOC109230022 n=1 Tax=Nicotiana attenuata TaxID=49451 RepID=UPI0009047ADB|nr:PREDICTED: uncharacterized protein LOC109230022 [Nicotiana attenuata]
MASESHLPIINPLEDSPASVIPTLEPATAEENRILRLRMLEMWDAWSNGREPPSAIPGFPELIPKTSGTSNVPITNPFTPFGYPTISSHLTGTPSEVRPQALFSGVSSTMFTAPPTSTTAQPTVPRPGFEPSAFTFQVPQFQLDTAHVTPNSYPQHPRYESTLEQQRTVKNPEQEEITRKMNSIEQSLKNMQGLSSQKSVSYADLCMFPHVHLPVGFKMPKIEKYDGHGHPIAHLKKYYISHWRIWDDLARDFVRQFQYNVDLAPDRNSLSNLKKKSSESFREYAIKWCEQVARVKPPMDEAEMFENGSYHEPISYKSHFSSNQSGSGGVLNRKKKEEGAMMALSLRNPHQSRGYFGSPSSTSQHYYPHQDAAYAMTPHPYASLPKVGPNGPVTARTSKQERPRVTVLPACTRCAYHSVAEGHDTEDCWTFKRAVENLIEQKRVVLRDEEVPNVTNNPLPTHNNGLVIGMICEDKEFDPALKAIIAIADVEKKPKAVAKQAKNEKKIKSTPQSTEKAMETMIGAAPPKNAVLYVPRAPRKEQFVLSPPKRFEQNKVTLKVPKIHAPQNPMKDPTAIPWNYNKAVVTYKGKEIMGGVNETYPSGKYLNLEELNKTKQKCFPLKKSVSAEEAEEFFRKMKTSDYVVIDQLRKSPSQVSLLSLMISSKHQKVLLKTLNEAYVPVETTVEQLERMAEQFFEVNRISFS